VFLDRWFDGKKTAYFTYNGKYDFYLGTRFSSPVVSRLQNPGLSIKTKYDTPRMWGITDFSLGWFHESNGQNIETQQAYDLTNNARDYVSRGWDYLGVSIESQHQYEHKPLNAYLHLRLFCDCQAFGAIGEKEDSVFWKSVDKQPDIRDFDGLRIVLSFLKNKDLRFSTQFRLGTYALDSLTNVSTRLEITVRVKEIPLTVFYFTGYGSEIAYYQEKGHYLGVGLEFW
jgi:outer membrane phospholipase A